MHILSSDISTISDLKAIEQAPWPIPESLSLDISETVFRCVRKITNQFPNSAYLFVTDNVFNVFLIQYIHAELVKSKCGGISQLAIGELAKPVYMPDWEELSVLSPLRPQRYDMRRTFLGIAKSAKENKGRIRRGEKYLSLGSSSRLKQEFLALNNINASAKYFDQLKVPNLAEGTCPVCDDIATAFIEEIDKALVDFCLNGLPDRAQLISILRVRYSQIDKLARAFEPVARKYEGLVVTQAANPIHKIISQSFMAEGKSTAALHHGNSFGHILNAPGVYAQQYSYAYFVSPTKNISRAFMARRDHFNLRNALISKHVSVETGYYRNLYCKYREEFKSVSKKVKSVMVIGYPMNANLYSIPGGFFYRQLQIEFALVRYLRAKNFRVIYKVHPERKKYVVALISPYVDLISDAPFEKVWPQADLFLFTHSCTTTFGFALHLPRPIILIDWEKSYWLRGHESILEQRCWLVRSGSEPVPWFSESDLAEGLDADPVNFDVSGVQYLFNY